MFVALVSSSRARRPLWPDEPDFRHRPAPEDVGRFGMLTLLASLGVFFIAGLALYFTLRLTSPHWPQPGLLRLPAGLWLSTAVLLLSGLTMRRAVRGIRAGRLDMLQRAMAITTVLAAVFLLLQATNWYVMHRSGLAVVGNQYAALFYVLTALHALHVIGGLVPLALVTGRAYAGRYTARRYAGVRYCAMYWHFLGGVWLVLFTVLLAPI